MFSNLRQDNILFVLNKKDGLTLTIAKNLRLGTPYPEYPAKYPLGNNSMLIDIEAEDGGSTLRFTKLPANLSSHEYDGVFITESRDAVQAELEAMKARSLDILNSREYHEKVIEACDKYLPMVNPSIAKEQEQESRLQTLEEQMGTMSSRIEGMGDVLSEIHSMLKKSK